MILLLMVQMQKSYYFWLVATTQYLTYFETRREVEKLSLGSEVDKRCTFP
jgi:hypothetical protein